ncbi:hypothetical protein [Actinoplanes sp. NPDC005259]|uniref:hypothetical protein n=1 Tax=Actinoplanes sp. NPDC005259 TaxID=3154674 RepID=UPI0033B138A3
MTAIESEQPIVVTHLPAAEPPAPPARGLRWRDVAAGAVYQAEESTAGLLADLRRVAAQRERWLGELAARGAAERELRRKRAAEAAHTAVTAAATLPVVNWFVDAQLERVLRPLVRGILDDVLGLLEKEPDRIQALIQGQRETMVDELIGRIRTGAANGDSAVDRLTFRMFHRGPRPAPAPPFVDGA